MPVPSQGRCLNNHSAPTVPNVQPGMASENPSTHNHLFWTLKKPSHVRASQAPQGKSPSLQEPAGTVSNTDTRLRETLTQVCVFHSGHPGQLWKKTRNKTCYWNHFWNRAAIIAWCGVSLVLYHHSSPVTTCLHWGGRRGHPQAACSPWTTGDS